MTVRHNPVVGTLMLVIGLGCTFLGLWLLMLGEFSPAVIAGIVPALLGVLYLVRPYFRVHPGVVEIPATFGPVKRTFEFASLDAADGKLHAVRPDGTRQRVPVARWLAHPGDWADLVGGVR